MHGGVVRTSSVTALAFSSNGRFLASSAGSGDIFIWNISFCNPADKIAPLEGHGLAVRAIAWSHHEPKLASGSDDMTARIWDTETWTQLFVLDAHKAHVTGVFFRVAWTELVSEDAAGYRCTWDTVRGTRQSMEKVKWGHGDELPSSVYDTMHRIQSALPATEGAASATPLPSDRRSQYGSSSGHQDADSGYSSSRRPSRDISKSKEERMDAERAFLRRLL